jgi:general transcription factor 3C polypeptide 6
MGFISVYMCSFPLPDAPPKSFHDGMAPPKENKGKQASNSKEAAARSRAVKHLASVQKILKFQSIGEDHQSISGQGQIILKPNSS